MKIKLANGDYIYVHNADVEDILYNNNDVARIVDNSTIYGHLENGEYCRITENSEYIQIRDEDTGWYESSYYISYDDVPLSARSDKGMNFEYFGSTNLLLFSLFLLTFIVAFFVKR